MRLRLLFSYGDPRTMHVTTKYAECEGSGAMETLQQTAGQLYEDYIKGAKMKFLQSTIVPSA